MTQILIRFLVGGAVVSLFALIGDVLKPKRFAGLFGAAPSVALATLSLTIAREGASYAAIEARSMMAGLHRRLARRSWRVVLWRIHDVLADQPLPHLEGSRFRCCGEQ